MNEGVTKLTSKNISVTKKFFVRMSILIWDIESWALACFRTFCLNQTFPQSCSTKYKSLLVWCFNINRFYIFIYKVLSKHFYLQSLFLKDSVSLLFFYINYWSQKVLKFRPPDCWKMHFQRSPWMQKHRLYIIDKHGFFHKYYGLVITRLHHVSWSLWCRIAEEWKLLAHCQK